MKRIQQGFTLIELMIVVAILGILASIALPAYQDYVYRAKMSEVILAASACRTVISEVWQSGGSAPAANSWGCGEGILTTKYVAGIATTADGTVLVTAQGLAVANGVVSMVPTDSAGAALTAAGMAANTPINAWRCGLPADGTTVPLKFLPGTCRGN